MRIKGTCTNCGREFFPEQVAENGGHCPWCGKEFNPDYTSLIVQYLRQAEVAGEALQDALDQIASIEELSMVLDEESLLEPLRHALHRIRRRSGARV